jgi:hypothetical protein
MRDIEGKVAREATSEFQWSEWDEGRARQHTCLDCWRLKQKSRRGIRTPRRLLESNFPPSTFDFLLSYYPIPRESSVGSSIAAVVASP